MTIFRPPALIEIDRDDTNLTLSVYDRHLQAYVVRKVYDVAVGTDEYRTPTGRFRVTDRQFHPTWVAPRSDWVPEEKWGMKLRADDPTNPIKGRWIGFHGAVGIHGTADDLSIGKAASHGCVRMHVADVQEVYPWARVGTPVIVRGRQP